MLREEVLREWKSYKKKIIDFKKGVAFLVKQYEHSILPAFPIDLNFARNQLDTWTGYEYLAKIDTQRNKIWDELPGNSESLNLLGMSLTDTMQIFKDLTRGWQKEKDSYARYRQNDFSGPTIEEVDDW